MPATRALPRSATRQSRLGNLHAALDAGEHGSGILQGTGIHPLELLDLLPERPPVHALGLADQLSRADQEPLLAAQGAAQLPRSIQGSVALVGLLAGVVQAQAVTAGEQPVCIQLRHSPSAARAQEPRAFPSQVARHPLDGHGVIHLLGLAVERY